jgi:hypothetical protein
MQNTQLPVSPEIKTLIESTIREVMTPFGYRGVHVRAGEDHDGDPVIFVDVDYDLSANPLEIGITGQILTPLRDKMWAAGETRFPHIRHRFHERQSIKIQKRARA